MANIVNSCALAPTSDPYLGVEVCAENQFLNWLTIVQLIVQMQFYPMLNYDGIKVME